MVAYSFHKRFVPMIEDGSKTQTIRAGRKRHARVGEPVQLYHGMRTKQCRKLIVPDPICVSVKPISMVLMEGHPRLLWMIELGGETLSDYDTFAVADGFTDRADMGRFWIDNHGGPTFDGFLIEWEARADV